MVLYPTLTNYPLCFLEYQYRFEHKLDQLIIFYQYMQRCSKSQMSFDPSLSHTVGPIHNGQHRLLTFCLVQPMRCSCSPWNNTTTALVQANAYIAHFQRKKKQVCDPNYNQLQCAIKLPHANVSIFDILLNIQYHNIRI